MLTELTELTEGKRVSQGKKVSEIIDVIYLVIRRETNVYWCDLFVVAILCSFAFRNSHLSAARLFTIVLVPVVPITLVVVVRGHKSIDS